MSVTTHEKPYASWKLACRRSSTFSPACSGCPVADEKRGDSRIHVLRQQQARACATGVLVKSFFSTSSM